MTYRAYLIAAGIALSPLTQAAEPDAAPKTNPNDSVIIINDSKVSQADYDAYAAARNRQSKKTVGTQVIVDELITRELLYQQALKAKLENDPVYQERLQTMRYNLLSERMMRKHLADNPISDDEVRKTYDQLPNNPEWPTEYQASHILVDDEAAAKAIIEELKAGKDFAELAKDKSNDTGSGKQGGSLGWFGLHDMVKPFSASLETLEKGKYTQIPVKSKFGWHIIKLEDSRPLKLPEFESVKERLRKNLQNELMGHWIEALRAKSKIDIQIKLDDKASLDDKAAAGK